MEFDRRAFLAGLGGASAIALMSSEAKADALEHHLAFQLNAAVAKKFPTAAEIAEKIDTRPTRRGVGNLFASPTGNVKRLPPMPESPTLLDFFSLRFTPRRIMFCRARIARCERHVGGDHSRLPAARRGAGTDQGRSRLVGRAALRALRFGKSRVRHPLSSGAALLRRPCARLRVSGSLPQLFGDDYKPEPYIEATYKMVRNHKWYMEPRLVTVNDLYAFDPNVEAENRSVHRHHRPPFQAAERGPRIRQQSVGAHVAFDRDAGSSALRFYFAALRASSTEPRPRIANAIPRIQ